MGDMLADITGWFYKCKAPYHKDNVDTSDNLLLQIKNCRELILPSEQAYPILGLNLLRLLVQNMMAEFHTEFLANDHTCIKHADELRRLLYNRVLSSRQAVPHKTYVYFMDLLAKAVSLRDEIAGCNEKAYDSLSLADAKKILMFASDQEWQVYVWPIIPI